MSQRRYLWIYFSIYDICFEHCYSSGHPAMRVWCGGSVRCGMNTACWETWLWNTQVFQGWTNDWCCLAGTVKTLWLFLAVISELFLVTHWMFVSAGLMLWWLPWLWLSGFVWLVSLCWVLDFIRRCVGLYGVAALCLSEQDFTWICGFYNETMTVVIVYYGVRIRWRFCMTNESIAVFGVSRCMGEEGK